MDPLVYYIKENIKKYSEKDLKLAIEQEGYSSQEIGKAFEQAKKPTLEKESLGFFVAVMLALTFGVIVVIKPFILLTIFFYDQQILRYLLILVAALLLGWLCNAVIQKTTKKAGLRIVAGIAIAAIPTEIMIIVLSMWGFLSSIIGYLTQIGGGSIPTALSSAYILNVKISPTDVLLLSLMFFIIFNIMFLISSLKEEKKGILALYLFAPALYLGIFYLVRFVLNSYLLGILPKV